ncbi:MAG: DUF1330 domain-containing protein [Thermodesulfobacteriota bacterium]
MVPTPAYLIGHITVKNEEQWAEYRKQVPATLAAFNAEVVFRGKCKLVLSGRHAYTDTVVIRFPDLAAIEGWHQSPAYQALIPIREEAADMVLIGYDS